MSVSYYWLRFQSATAQTVPWLFCTDAICCGSENNQYWGVRYQICWCGIEKKKVCWMHSCSSLCDISNFFLYLNRNSLSQSASSCPGRCHSIWEAIQHCTSYLFPAQDIFASSSITLPSLIHQFTRDIASCLRELLTFKECCGIDTCGRGFEQITCGATTCLQNWQLAVVYELIYSWFW